MVAHRVCSIGPLSVAAIVLLGAVAVKSAVFNSAATVKTARCYANCLSQVKNSKPDLGCRGDECKKCVAPCKVPFTTIQKCKSICKKSKICETSCQFLLDLKSKPNVQKDIVTEKPGSPVAVAKTVTNLTLSWKPAKASEGNVVYLLKERYTGDFRSRRPIEHSMVFFEAKAVITVQQVCLFAPRFRFKFKGLNFFFTVIALTENSKMAAGKESSAIHMKRPDPVVHIAIPHLRFDPTSIGDKLRLTTIVIPSPGQAKLVTRYSMKWRMKFCKPFVVPRSSLSRGASRNIIIFIWQKLKACNHTLEVHALVECIPSLPKNLTYEYKGCRFVDNFNKTFCHSFDPPPTPDSAREVRNLRHGPLQVTDDFRVNTTFLWLPPTFPFAPVSRYVYAYGDVTRLLLNVIWIATRGTTKETSLRATNLHPNITVRVEILPLFPNAAGVKRNITFRTPAVPEEQIRIHKLRADKFVLTTSNLFYVRVSWNPPPFTKGLVGYHIQYLQGKQPEKSTTTNTSFYVFTGIMHSEPLLIEVKPLYNLKWIKPKGVALLLRASDPYVRELVVGDLKVADFTYNKNDNTYAVSFTWNPPVFQKYRAVDYYQMYFHLIGHSREHLSCPSYRFTPGIKCPPTRAKTAKYLLPNVRPEEFIVLSVKPVFKDSPYVQGFMETITVDRLEFTCKGKHSGYYKDITDCIGYYQCDSLGNKHHFYCPGGLFWNDKIQACDWSMNVKCKQKQKSFCDGKDRGYYRDPKDCGAFYHCDDHGYTHHLNCAKGLHWNENINTCVPQDKVKCKHNPMPLNVSG